MAAYRMTSARRAALRKAQLASAAKRRRRKLIRRRIVYGAAVGVGSVTLAGAVYGHKLLSGGPRNVTSYAPKQLKAGRNRQRGNPNPIKPRKGVFKVATQGSHFKPTPAPQLIRRPRSTYDAKRRAAYAKRTRTTPRRRAGGKYG